MSDKKMEIWERVCKTDPNHTKRVNQRGGFTAIDAHYQVMRATEAFGPVGKGWSYQVQHSNLNLPNDVVLALADVTVRYKNGAANWYEYGPVRGASPWVDGKGRVDDDAAKKATTDALTKALSYLGFSADVFLGKYDDNKYLNEVKQEFGMKARQAEEDQNDADEEWKDGMLEQIKKAKSEADLESIRKSNRLVFSQVQTRNKAAAMVVSTAMQSKLNQLKGETANG